MITIEVEITAGSSILDAFKSAIALADKLDCFVNFDFNGVSCTASPESNPKKGVDEYNQAIKSGSDYKFAISWSKDFYLLPKLKA